MDNVFQTILVNTILQGKNANLWKGDFIVSNINPELSWMTRESRKDILDKYVLGDAMLSSGVSHVVRKCWVASGEYVDCFDMSLDNISVRVYFDGEKVHMHVEFVNYLIERKEYEVTHVRAERLIAKLMEIDDKVGQMERDWPEHVRQCSIKAKSIELRTSAVRGYMQNRLQGTSLTYDLRTTSECIVVSLMAEGKIELSTSLTDEDDMVYKLDGLLEEMDKKLVNSL